MRFFQRAIQPVKSWIRKIRSFFSMKKGEADQPVSPPCRQPPQPGLPLSRETLPLQIRYFLLNNGIPAGKAICRRHPQIRIIHVNNFTDAYIFFLHLCDQRQMVVRQAAGHLHYKITLPDHTGSLELCDQINRKGENTIAVLTVRIPPIEPFLSEIRFVKAK